MDALGIGVVTALWLGLLTSISPCPLATNVAAMSFIGRRVDKPRLVVLTGLVYTLGRMTAYVFLGIILVAGLLSAPQLSHALQSWMAKLIGPLLILLGMVLVGLLTIPAASLPFGERLRARAESGGVLGAGVLGLLFALSFCPISAALFFGSLVPLAIRLGSRVVLPSVYGLGTGLPVFLFAVLIAVGAQRVGRAFNALTAFEKWARTVTGIVFIGLGIYESLRSIFGVI
ncbi:MAG TPA: aromatic aminobenezylarsenical efflux permease ArsG family transporter [Isosphaeraceae bacterium]|nr:aromatic aminobenezylarsenical efflux permease ArsG family transporter [Isosphaeraceae bacterium]